MKYYGGEGLLNTAINNLPVELHIPTYRYCGPGTKLAERLARNDPGVNGLDEACKQHDIFYSKEKDLSNRHLADKVLAKQAMNRFRASDSSWKEKVAALAVAGAMKAKVKLGMGLKETSQRHQKRNINNCLKKLHKLAKELEGSQKLVQDSVQILQTEQSQKAQKNILAKVKEKSKSSEKKVREVREIKKHETKNNSVVKHETFKVKRERKTKPNVKENKRGRKPKSALESINEKIKRRKKPKTPIEYMDIDITEEGQKNKPKKRKLDSAFTTTRTSLNDEKVKKRKIDLDDPIIIPEKKCNTKRKRESDNEENEQQQRKLDMSDVIPHPWKQKNRKRKIQPDNDNDRYNDDDDDDDDSNIPRKVKVINT
ncbi:unnamed protein product [Acanthoscelides obtectus]|uniref:Phospholipase A2-like domain-containing protein n=1 Tax=Acanthoscelides obtectus TaxID=200917 RepID=A0A9P0LYK0_ACAOB|nr:unnamed protein product [Acanthoscelides obtectus]CAK1643307.1 hypothetical protein AOBTE_LOCUS13489 [Acanthoscelides obtectus]